MDGRSRRDGHTDTPGDCWPWTNEHFQKKRGGKKREKRIKRKEENKQIKGIGKKKGKEAKKRKE